jgi:plasmid stabilization system protein ParE
MAMKISWSPEAEATFSAIVNYLENKWSEKEVRNFVTKTKKVIDRISRNPKLFIAFGEEEVRKAVITKQNSLFYWIDIQNEQIKLLAFWDNRKNPNSIRLKK